jgi:GNAT superfamily N-acetyltransferase
MTAHPFKGEPPTIRAGQTDDAARIAHVIRTAKAEAMPWLAVPHSAAEDEQWIVDILLPQHTVRLACDHRDPARVVAVLATSPGWLDQLYVAPGEQSKGIGSRLLRFAQHEARGPLALWTFQRNSRARTFYRKHGFVEVRRTAGDNEEGEPDILYRWQPTRL